MNYEYLEAFLEIKFPSGIIKRINKRIIKTISQYERGGKPYINIWVEGENFVFDGTMEDFDKNSKTIYM